MLTILDVNDRWQSGTDARAYQAEKLEFMSRRMGVRHVVIQPDVGTWTHTHGRSLVEHVGTERGLISGRRLRDLVALHRPDVIECGSPAVLPLLVQIAAARLTRRPALLGYWHGDLVREQVTPRLAGIDARLRGVARAGEQLATWWTTQGFAGLDAVLVPSRDEARMLAARGLDRLYLTPLGVDAERFMPDRRDLGLVERLRAGAGDRPIVWTDADVTTVGPIYAELCRRSKHDPALILAGDDEPELRERFAAAREHVHAPDPSERPRWLASADVALVLGGAVACAEAMACGRAIVARVGTRAGESVRDSGGGWGVHGRDPAAIATATVALLAAPDREALGARGRATIGSLDWAASFERLLSVYAEVLEHVRRGARVPAGVHERMEPSALPEAAYESAQSPGQGPAK